MRQSQRAAAYAAERAIGRLLIGVTYGSVALLLVGVLLLFAAGISPVAGGPAFDPARLIADLRGLRPEGFLWIGLVALIGGPAARVVVALIAYVRDEDWLMVGVSVGILVVIALAVATALLGTA